jgi:hypothetical protein
MAKLPCFHPSLKMWRGRGHSRNSANAQILTCQKKARRMTNGATAESTDFGGAAPGKWIPYVGGKWFFPMKIEFDTFGGDR